MRLRELFANPFFPDLGFAWVFVLVLIALTFLAAVYDTRKAIIPKWVTLGTLGVGVVFNLIRGVWLGSQGAKVWWFPEGSAGVGAADGFLFALAGFAVGFGIFFGIWILGACGGGDVKLMAALGAWLGPMGVVLMLILSTVVLFVWVLGNMVFGGSTLKSLRRQSKTAPPPHKGGKSRQRRVTFSFPAAVTSLILVYGVFGEDLGVKPKRTAPPPQGESRVDVSPKPTF